MKNLSNSVFLPVIFLLILNIRSSIQDISDKTLEECEKIRKLHPNYHIDCNPKNQENLADTKNQDDSEGIPESKVSNLDKMVSKANLISNRQTKRSLKLPTTEDRMVIENQVKKESKVLNKGKNNANIPEQNDIDSTISNIETISPDGNNATPLNVDTPSSAQEFIDKAISDTPKFMGVSENNKEFRFKQTSNPTKSSKNIENQSYPSSEGSSDYIALANLELHKLFSDSLSSFKNQLGQNFTSLRQTIETTYNVGEERNKEMLNQLKLSQKETNSELELLKNNAKSIQENSVESQSMLKIIDQISKNQEEMTKKMNNLSEEFESFKKTLKLKSNVIHNAKKNTSDEIDDDSDDKIIRKDVDEDDEDNSSGIDEDEIEKLLSKKLRKKEKEKVSGSSDYKNKIINLIRKLAKN